VQGEDVDGESMGRAVKLVAYFKSHARKAYAVMDADRGVAEARRVLACLARHPEMTQFTRRDLYQHLRRHFGRPDALDAPLKLLVEHGYLRVAGTGPAPNKPRPRTERYEVNPLWDRSAKRTQGTRNPRNPDADDPPEGELVDIGDIVYAPEE
jgi:hypothetical protein